MERVTVSKEKFDAMVLCLEQALEYRLSRYTPGMAHRAGEDAWITKAERLLETLDAKAAP